MFKYFLSLSIILLPLSAMAESGLKVRNIKGEKVINITQIPCQFVESEGKDKKFKTRSKSECEKINERTKERRVVRPLVLKPGKYTFRVTNSGVPYEVGFYLRGTGFGWLTHSRVSGGGLTNGVTKNFTVDLKPGNYLYSCPLNPTLDYPLTVENE